MSWPPEIPKIGEPMTCIFWYPSALVRCNCQPPEKATLMMLQNMNTPAVCPQCHRAAAIVSVSREGKVEIGVTQPPVVN